MNDGIRVVPLFLCSEIHCGIILASNQNYSSLRQLEAKGICVDEYLTNERDGVFKARLDCKRWGKKRNILAYFTFEDGSKVMASAWQNTGYLGIPEIEEGARLMLTFERAKNGISYLRKVDRNEVE